MVNDEEMFEAEEPKENKKKTKGKEAKETKEEKVTMSLSREEAVAIYIALSKEAESYYKLIETLNNGEATTKILNQLGKFLEKK
jgi:hypothetical protein